MGVPLVAQCHPSSWKDLPLRLQGNRTVTESRQTGCLVHWPLEKQNCYKICFWEVLILLPFRWCWRSQDGHGACSWPSGWPHFRAPVTVVWTMSKAGRCVPTCTSVHNYAESLLFQAWNRLRRNEATRKPRRASPFSCYELVSQLSLWIPLMPHFASISLKILQKSVCPWPHALLVT